MKDKIMALLEKSPLTTLDDMYEIDRYLKSLELAADKLWKLEGAGVDNWDWYGEAMSSGEDEEEFD